MPDFAVNHVSMAGTSYATLLAQASALGCVGVEVRCDLAGPLFDGASPENAAALASSCNLRILSLAELGAFDDDSPEKRLEADQLMQLAAACGAEAVSLIPRNDGFSYSDDERHERLISAMTRYKPMLESYGLVGLIEPLGFASCTLRSKRAVVAAIDALQARHCFKLVHDTFHHFIAGEAALYPEHTGIVHVSGVTRPSLDVDQMQDAHRGLVDQHDRIDNVGQIAQLLSMGYRGPISMEAFSPEVHALTDPRAALHDSFNFIAASLAVNAA